MRRAFIVTLVLGVLVALSIREYRLHNQHSTEEAFIGQRGATVWNSTAEIRTPVANLNYGERVQIHQHYAHEALVSTASGVRGWVSSASLMDPDLWHSATVLAKSAQDIPVQASGHTRARANLHTQPGAHSPVILQAPADSPLVVFQHALASDSRNGGAISSGSEDWWLVRADVKNAGSITGWALGRLLKFDLPEPLPGYESSEGIHVVAWFKINRALDSISQTYRPEYLVAGNRVRRPACDFTLLRVYTWSSTRRRYETAFMDSRVCGKLPVQVTPAKLPSDDAYFSFDNAGAAGAEKRTYRMRLTTVRRIDASNTAHGASKSARAGRDHT